MPRNILPSEDFLYDRASLVAYHNGEADNSAERKKMLGILKKAMEQELTETQRFCIREYFFEGKKMKDIASTLSVNPSTVTRHIRRAKEKLKHIASYY